MTAGSTSPSHRLPRGDAIWFTAGIAIYAVGLVIASIVRLPLTWDGAWFFLRAMDTGSPTFLHRRVLHAVLQAPAIASRALVDDPALASLVFSLAYAAVPVVALVAARRMIPPERRALLLWPILGIALVALPGQSFLLSESLMVMALAWPLGLAAILGSLAAYRWLALGLAVAIAIAHPFGGPVLVGIGLAAGLARVRDDGGDPRWIAIAFVIAGLALTLLQYAVRSPYEAQAGSPGQLLEQFRVSLVGPELAGPLAAWAIGLAALVPMAGRVRAAVIVAILAAAAVVLVPWASDPVAWGSALGYRALLPFLALPLAAMAVIDVWRRAPGPDRRVEVRHLAGRRIAWLGAPLVATVVLTIQSTTWAALGDRLGAAVAASGTVCLRSDDLAWTERTALDHWAITSLALVLEGRGPRHLLVHDRACADAFGADRITVKVTPFDRDDRTVGGWWRFETLVDAWANRR